ncbi:hypothetical protein Tfu_0041 [Thermobifida fusca YX]|uniref:Uncharacterized protein n=1 Tax=Thermobifida fusca (strain YX) TaxID=269800 RepID=Q47TY5_THEFY|nr:hypothetical protein Tfu_0041 [Thermobifida fusca YX]
MLLGLALPTQDPELILWPLHPPRSRTRPSLAGPWRHASPQDAGQSGRYSSVRTTAPAAGSHTASIPPQRTMADDTSRRPSPQTLNSTKQTMPVLPVNRNLAPDILATVLLSLQFGSPRFMG